MTIVRARCVCVWLLAGLLALLVSQTSRGDTLYMADAVDSTIIRFAPDGTGAVVPTDTIFL
jgi:hypothetical protein